MIDFCYYWMVLVYRLEISPNFLVFVWTVMLNGKFMLTRKMLYPTHNLSLLQSNAKYTCLRLFNTLPVNFPNVICES